MDNHEVHQKSTSPPALVDCSPLQSSMERNRESLKIKLMVRRSANQLVEQGILPPLKTSPAIHEQKKLLERAKTGDLLKAKIQQRPDRQELERRHILESHESHIDPSLADKYRMLEKAILVDQLNSKISHRPGPLELIEKNILHANEPIERIVKEGLVPFKASSEHLYIEDDSQSSEGDINSQGDNSLLKGSINILNDQQIKLSSASIEHVAPPLNVINLNLPLHTSVIAQSALVPKLTLQIPTVSNEHETITLPCLVTTESLVPITATTTTTKIDQNEGMISNEKLQQEPSKESKVNIDGNIKHHISSFLQNNQKISSSGKEKIKKKCKIKPTSKIKAIKFHEYKGPPNAQKNSTSLASTSSASTSSSSGINKKLGETNYELIMQQQCLLEYLEGIYKNPNKSESDAQHQEKQISNHDKVNEKFADETKPEDVKKPFITIFPSKSPTATNTTVDKDSLITDASKLGKLKVSELKSYLKKLNLPVSGPKPLLIERLKPYLPFKPSEICKGFEKVECSMRSSPESKDPLTHKLSSNSLDSLDLQSTFKDDDIVKEQQRQIEELQRKLLESQSELEQIRLNKVSESTDGCINNNDQFFQLIPDTSNPIQATTSVLYDTKYQLPSNKVSTVFVVGVTPINSTETIPMLVQEQIEDTENNNASSNNTSNNKNQQIIDQSVVLSPALTSRSDIELSDSKSNNPLYSNAIVQDDINDVLEILLKNEKWNEGDENFHADKSEDLEKNQILLDKEILGGALLHNNEIISQQVKTHEGTIKNENLMSYPMEVEENSNSSPNNIDALSYFRKDSHADSLPCNGFDSFCHEMMKNNNNFDKNNDSNNYNGIKNSLIGNFDNGMFDTFKTNIVNSPSGVLLNDMDQKEPKFNNDKYIFNNINNFDMFGGNTVELPTTPMDFENIISYDIYQQHDPFFGINNFQNIPERENFLNSHVGNTSNAMFCEDDNMLDTGHDLKW